MTFDDAAAALDQAAAEAPQIAAQALSLAASQALGPVVDAWPVQTGRSAAGWRAVPTSTGGRLTNSVPYAGDVRDGLADQLVPAVLAEAEARTVQDIEDKITATLEGA